MLVVRARTWKTAKKPFSLTGGAALSSRGGTRLPLGLSASLSLRLSPGLSVSPGLRLSPSVSVSVSLTVFCLCLSLSPRLSLLVSVSLLVPQSLSLLDSVPLSVPPTHTHTTCTQQESQEQRPEAGKCRPGSPFWGSQKRQGRRKRGTERRPQATWHRKSGVGGPNPARGAAHGWRAGSPRGAECLQTKGSVSTLTRESCGVLWDARRTLQGRAHG